MPAATSPAARILGKLGPSTGFKIARISMLTGHTAIQLSTAIFQQGGWHPPFVTMSTPDLFITTGESCVVGDHETRSAVYRIRLLTARSISSLPRPLSTALSAQTLNPT